MSNNVGIVRCVVAELNPEKRYDRMGAAYLLCLSNIIIIQLSDTSIVTPSLICKRWNATWAACRWIAQFRKWAWSTKSISIRSTQHIRSSSLCCCISRRVL